MVCRLAGLSASVADVSGTGAAANPSPDRCEKQPPRVSSPEELMTNNNSGPSISIESATGRLTMTMTMTMTITIYIARTSRSVASESEARVTNFGNML